MTASDPESGTSAVHEAHVDSPSTINSEPAGDANGVAEAATGEFWATSTRNPLNWSLARKWTIIIVMSITNFVAAMTTAYEPALDHILRDLHAEGQDSLGTLSITIYTLGYCIGPLILAPLSEVYGRIWLFRGAYLIFLLALVGGGASQNMGAFIAFRAITGFAGIVFLLLGSAIVPDIMPHEKRGISLGVILTGAGLGPTLGPIMGGYVVERTTWRWIFWACVIAFGILAIVSCCILTETYGPVLEKQYAKRNNHASTDPPPPTSGPTKRLSKLVTLFKGPWVRPVQMLIRSPIVLLFALYTTVTQGYLLLVFATLGLVFQDHYHFSPGSSGLAYLGLAIGLTISQFVLGHLSDKNVARMARLHNGVHKPEDRLAPLIVGALIVPVSLFWYGWGTHSHWIVPIIGSAVFAVGYMCTYLPIMMYLIDAYSQHAASAIAACSVLRSICSAVLPLAADPLYRRLGYDWGNSLLAFVALAFFPFTVVLARYGEKIRTKFEPKFD